jgi:hypothetical protein
MPRLRTRAIPYPYTFMAQLQFTKPNTAQIIANVNEAELL